MARSYSFIFRDSPERVSPGKGKQAPDDRDENGNLCKKRRAKIGQRVARGEEAEVDAQRENQLDELCRGLPQLQQCGPKDVCEDKADEIEVLRQLERKISQDFVFGLTHNCVGEPCGSGQERDSSQPEITAYFHLLKYGDVQTDQAEIQDDRQQRVSVEIRVPIAERLIPIMSEDVVTPPAHEKAENHI